MKVLGPAVAGLVAGALAAFVAALLRPRRPGGYDPGRVEGVAGPAAPAHAT